MRAIPDSIELQGRLTDKRYLRRRDAFINRSRSECGTLAMLRRTPSLEHQHVPQRILVVTTPRQVIEPGLPDRDGIEEVILPEARLAQEILGPVAQRAAQPAVDRNAKAHLWPLDESRRHVFVEQLPQRPFGLIAGPQHGQRQRHGEADDAMIEHWHPG